MQTTEMKGVEGKLDDENSGSAEFPGVTRNGGYRSAINLCFLMFSCLIFKSLYLKRPPEIMHPRPVVQWALQIQP